MIEDWEDEYEKEVAKEQNYLKQSEIKSEKSSSAANNSRKSELDTLFSSTNWSQTQIKYVIEKTASAIENSSVKSAFCLEMLLTLYKAASKAMLPKDKLTLSKKLKMEGETEESNKKLKALSKKKVNDDIQYNTKFYLDEYDMKYSKDLSEDSEEEE